MDVVHSARACFITTVLVTVCPTNGWAQSGTVDLEPIPGGFSAEDRIDHAIQFRLTQPGFDFLQTHWRQVLTSLCNDPINQQPGSPFNTICANHSEEETVISLPIPFSDDGEGTAICTNCNCSAEVGLRGLAISTEAPNRLKVHLEASLRAVAKTKDNVQFLDGWIADLNAFGKHRDCVIELDTFAGKRDFVGIDVIVEFTEQSRNVPGKGFTTATIQDVRFTSSQNLENKDINIGSKSFGRCGISAVDGLFPGMVRESLLTSVKSVAQGFTCLQPQDGQCPEGSEYVPGSVSDRCPSDEPPAGKCNYVGTDQCVPFTLGVEGQGNLGKQLLGTISPGTDGFLQFLLAAFGPIETDRGVSVSLAGGLRSVSKDFTQPHAKHLCVPKVPRPPVPAVPKSRVFLNDRIPGSGKDAHALFGISEAYLNEVAYGLFNSGAFCIDVDASLSSAIATPTFAIAISELTDLSFPAREAAMALSLRPKLPPRFDVGTDDEPEKPLLTLTFPSIQMDMYLWSAERYYRVLSYTTDLTVPLDVVVEGGVVSLKVPGITAENSSVFNNPVTKEDAAKLTSLLDEAFKLSGGTLADSLPSFELPTLFGLRLEIPDGVGIQGFRDENDQDFLGLFMSFVQGDGEASRRASTPLTSDDGENMCIPVDPPLPALDDDSQTTSGGCQAGPGGSQLPWFAFLVLLPFFMGRGRRGRAAKKYAPVVTLLLAVGVLAGCDPDKCDNACVPAKGTVSQGSVCCEPVNRCAAYDLEQVCGPGFVCASPDNIVIDEQCQIRCDACERSPGLDPGIIATHLDATLADNGDIMVVGYSPGVPPNQPYGDLLYATFNGDWLEWEVVEGAPTEPVVDVPQGWRKGVRKPGEDVGEYPSIAQRDGKAYIAYYDRDNRDLRVTLGNAAGAWASHVVDGLGDAGRYASLALDGDGRPVVAYLSMRPNPDDPERIVASLSIAHAKNTIPTSAGDWTITRLVSGPMPCRPWLCQETEACLPDGRCVTPSEGCDPACRRDGLTCVDGELRTALSVDFKDFVETWPPAPGVFNAMASTRDGLGLVYFDGRSNDLYAAEYISGEWVGPLLIDGASTGGSKAGTGPSLWVDSDGIWHISYIDFDLKEIRYARVDKGKIELERVADGIGERGKNWLGGNTSVVLTRSGTLQIAYQDLTDLNALLATKRSQGWQSRVVDNRDATGFFVTQVVSGASAHLLTGFRRAHEVPTSGVRVFTDVN